MANVKAFTHLINNSNVYYFSMIKCDLILLQTASIKFYSCVGIKIIYVWVNTMIRRFNRINFFIRQSFRLPFINVTAISNTSNLFKISVPWLKY